MVAKIRVMWLHRRFDTKNMWDNFCMNVAWMVPRRVAYWCAIRVGCYATQGEHSKHDAGVEPFSELLFMDALKRWS